jgi:hypothetical protein
VRLRRIRLTGDHDVEGWRERLKALTARPTSGISMGRMLVFVVVMDVR